MGKFLKILSWVFVSLGMLSLIIAFYLFLFNSQYFIPSGKFNLEIGNQFGGFLAGFVGIFFTGTGTFLVFLTFEQQRNQFKIAQFESSFFNLLSHLQLIVEQISGPVNWLNIRDSNVPGRRYLYYQIRELKELINKKTTLLQNGQLDKTELEKYSKLSDYLLFEDNNLQKSVALNKELLSEFIQEIYEDFYKTRYSFLSHYFRFVYHVIKFVHNSLIDQNDKQKYIDLIQAQMTSDELGLILFNGLGKIAKEKTYPLLEQYNFLSNLDTRLLPHPHSIVQLYPKTKFKYLKYDS